MKAVNFLVFLSCSFFLMAFSKNMPNRAEYEIPESEFSIAIEMLPAHQFLAEYSRELLLLKGSEVVAKQELLMDTGGYSDANLYDCGAGKYMITGYSDFYIVDLNLEKILEKECEESSRHYIGAFRWSEEKKWRFHLRSEQPEETLVPRGG